MWANSSTIQYRTVVFIILMTINHHGFAFTTCHRHQSLNKNISFISYNYRQLPVLLGSSSTQLFAKSGKKKKKPKDGTIAVNRAARRNYEIISTYDAGVSLLGSEVKSIRNGKMNLGDGYVRPSGNGRSCTLFNVHIGKNPSSGPYFQHEELRPRQLLLRKEESRKLLRAVEQSGMTIVPLKAYFSEKNFVKIQIGLGRGKNVRDKRAAIKDREAKRDADRMVKNFRIN